MANTVTIACKLPHGLLLQLQREVEVSEPTQTAPERKVKRWEKTGQSYAVKGFAQHLDAPQVTAVVGGFALTHGIPADFAKKWFEQNKDHSAVEGGFIFIAETPNDAQSYAEKHAGKKSGFEAADPKDLPREFRRQIETADVR